MNRTEQGRGEEHERLLGALLRIPYQALTVRIQQRLRAAGHPELHASHLAVLQHVQPAGTRMSELIERAQMTKQAINYLVEYLEARGYVRRGSDPRDGRAKMIYLTELGQEGERLAREAIKQSVQEWGERLGQQRMQQLQQTLQDLVALIEAEGEEMP